MHHRRSYDFRFPKTAAIWQRLHAEPKDKPAPDAMRMVLPFVFDHCRRKVAESEWVAHTITFNALS